MKNFILSITFPIVLFSCSTDELSTPEKTLIPQIDQNNDTLYQMPSSNPFDKLGVVFCNKRKLFNEFDVNLSSEKDIKDEIKLLFKNSRPDQITGLAPDPLKKLLKVIENSSLSVRGKSDLKNYIIYLSNIQGERYDMVYSFIVSYVAAILNASDLNTMEKKVILKVCSISKYSLYYEASRRDRDWETAVTNRRTRMTPNKIELTLICLAVMLERLL
ncbi:hypothetical protein [Flavobacterium sp. FlaQc-47]|uniref:hypothetical protein n=1 Tax=Flavobacterium sp. FlaQc-47 TaxID=3374180 RepID=UPI0037573BDA